MVLEDLRGRRRPPLHPVDHHHVGAGLGRELHVVVHPRGPELHEDRDLPVRRFPELLDLDDEIVRAEEIGMASGAALVHADREVPLLGDRGGHFGAE